MIIHLNIQLLLYKPLLTLLPKIIKISEEKILQSSNISLANREE
jgi:hypothetical protein